MIRDLTTASGFLILLTILNACHGIGQVSNNDAITGDYWLVDSLFGAHLLLREDSTYSVRLPSEKPINGKYHYEHEGHWFFKDNKVYLSCDNFPIVSSVYRISEHLDSTLSLDEFELILTTDADSLLRVLVGAQSDTLLPLGGVSALRLSGGNRIDIRRNRYTRFNWKSEDRKWLVIEDAGGYYPPYHLKSSKSNVIHIVMDADAPLIGIKFGECFFEEPLQIDGEYLILDDRYRFTKKPSK